MAHLQLTMQDATYAPTKTQLADLLASITALPIPEGAREIILTQKQAGGHIEVLRIQLSTQEANE